MLGINNIDIQDILYGGVAGEMPLPDLPDIQNLIITDQDSKPSLLSENSPPPEDPPNEDFSDSDDSGDSGEASGGSDLFCSFSEGLINQSELDELQ